MAEELVYGVIYSEFDEVMGPLPTIYVPPQIMNKKLGSAVATKTIDMYDDEDLSSLHSISVIPFTSENKKGLTKCFEWADAKKRGGIGTGSITLLFEEKDDIIFYKYMRDLELIFNESIEKIIESKNQYLEEEVFREVKQFYSKTLELLNQLNSQESGIQADSEEFPDEKQIKLSGAYQFKIIICGDPASGKTSTVLRFTDKAFRATYLPTLGVNITEKEIRYENSKVSLILWDIAGQVKFKTMRRQFYEGSQAALLLFDLTRVSTFNNILKWYEDIKKYKTGLPVILCGNKNDLKEDRVVLLEKGEKLAKKLNIEYIETSALTGENIDESFYKLVKKLVSDLEKS